MRSTKHPSTHFDRLSASRSGTGRMPSIAEARLAALAMTKEKNRYFYIYK